MEKINEEKCKHHDKENGWCKKLSDWSDPMPHIVYCPKSPCEHAEPIEQSMTDNDIIKTLECCVHVGCIECQFDDTPCCIDVLQRHVLDLINRQKAEIEKLKRKIKPLESIQEISPEAKHFVDTKADKVISLLNEAIKSQKQIKAEAIKEFAERLKSIREGCSFTFYSNRHFCESIDNLVEEMTESKMNKFHKLPIKERKRQAEYRFNQTDRQWEIQEAKMMLEDKRLKLSTCRELTDKERQVEEVMKRLKEMTEEKE